ncbi:protein O-mannosyl-transferase TMTC4 [Toxorhynchites rutilus septentrionalis]|uniref:protein O-mannosyl-transferase TMTC4 n=1 Tax=Toxorhynchites rutilus septentrionalis TaxID=329112 RepID=UPI00247845D5|nr:protein O-mannosyl-transferase TMTC4 [Toxorhynchites rutilus septentrionalis]
MFTNVNPMMNPMLQSIGRYSLLALLSFCCYFPTRHGTFVFDDTVAIVKNPDVTDKDSPLGDIWQHDFWGANLTDPTSHKSYRPLTILSFRQEVRMLGLDATQMKTTNWLLHTAIGLLLPMFYEVISWSRRMAHPFGVEYWSALLFVLHPIHTEAVSGIVGRAELLAALGFILVVLVYSKLFVAHDKNTFYCKHLFIFFVTFTLTALSVLCKETAITVLVFCAALDVLTHVNFQQPVSSFFKNRILMTRTVILSLMTGVLVYSRLWIQNFERPHFQENDNLVAASRGLSRVLSQSYLYCLNLWLLLCPDWLSFDWALESIRLVESFRDYRVIFTFLCFALLLAIITHGKPRRHVLKGMALMIIPFLPASGIIRVGFVIAERVLYIPSIGFCYLVSIGCARLFRRQELRTASGLGFLTLCLLFSARTLQRSAYWTNEHLLFRSALRVVPNNAKVHYNIARLATDEGDRRTAFAFYRQALELYPEYEAAHMNLGNLYRDEHNYPMALDHLKRAVEINEDFHTAWMNLGIVHAAMRNHKQALVCYKRALAKRKRYPNCVFNLGNLYNDMGNQSMALVTWNETVRQDPQHIKAWSNMVNVYDSNNAQQRVLDVTSRGLKHLPDNPTLLSSQATALAKMGRFQEAELIYNQLIDRHPQVEKYLQNMGVLYHRWGKLEQAERLYRKALKLNPKSDMAKSNLSKLLSARQQKQSTEN